MTKETVKKGKPSAAKADKVQNNHEFDKIIDGLKRNSKLISDAIKSRVGPGDWKLWQAKLSLDSGKESIDLVFSAPDGKKEKFVLLDVSIPHLQIGQKYSLPTKAKLFQKEQNVTLTRIKKAIVLVRKGTETISARPARIRCPIIEIQLEKIAPPARVPREKKQSAPVESGQQQNHQRQQEKKPQNHQGVSQDLLFALKEAIVHECLSTMHKRRNKYIRKGLWRWIEREIMDPNSHFFLIILSTIYQGKAGEVLSRKFKTPESFSSNADDVVSAIFSKETNLADEIKKSSERHKKALRKFLACFSQTPPFEYLRTLFLKEFRSTGDGLKARMSVFTTLNQLLERCGFEGEKETQYPLEILDELGIFQGIMTGNYAKLRIDNAAKKLKHLVPQANWAEDDIYLLRNQLAKALNLPPQEFNLNAFLPQAFFHDARVLAESRKEAFRSGPRQERQPQSSSRPEPSAKPESSSNRRPSRNDPRPARNDPRADRNDSRQDRNEPRQDRNEPRQDRNEPRQDRNEPRQDRNRHNDYSHSKTSDSPEMEARQSESRSDENGHDRSNLNPRGEKKRLTECDESGHRNFEFYGGHLDEDIDSVRLALAMSRFEAEQKEARKNSPSASELLAAKEEAEDLAHRPPTKPNSDAAFPINSTPPPRRRPSSSNRERGNNNAGGNSNNRRRKPTARPGQNKPRPRKNPGPSSSGSQR